MEQARRDAARSVERGAASQDKDGVSVGQCSGGAVQAKAPIVAHKRNHRPWLVTMEAETFFRLTRGDFAAERKTGGCAAKEEFEKWLSDFKAAWCGRENDGEQTQKETTV
jgi:hypothetical protein